MDNSNRLVITNPVAAASNLSSTDVIEDISINNVLQISSMSISELLY